MQRKLVRPGVRPAGRPTPGNASLPGAVSGCVGLLVFLVLHHVWIVPIWFILPIGLPVAVAGGVAVSRAYLSVRHRLPAGHGGSLALVGLVALCLVPSVVLAELREPMFELGAPGGSVLLMSPLRAAGVVVVELVATATIAGALIGWLVGRSRAAGMHMALAGFVFAIGPGHNVPFGGGTPAVPLELGIMALVALASAVALVGSHARQGASDPGPERPVRSTTSGPHS